MFLQPPLSQLCGMLSFTGNFEFLAKDSLITDLKQNLLGKVSQGKKGGVSTFHRLATLSREHPLQHKTSSSLSVDVLRPTR